MKRTLTNYIIVGGQNQCSYPILDRNIDIHTSITFYRFKSLEYLSCTEATQAWGYSKQEKTGLWGARPVQEMCCVRRAKPLVCKDDTFRVNLLSDAFSKMVAGKLIAIIFYKLEKLELFLI